MKKSFFAIVTIILTTFGANALAAQLELNVEKAATQTSNILGETNGRVGPTKGGK